MKDRKQCGNCALYIYEQQGCIRTQLHQEPSDSCSSFTREVPTCEICGQPFLPPATYLIEPDLPQPLVICDSCAAGLNTCRTCKNGNYCDFQQNPIDIPPMVQHIYQRGKMGVSQTVINPARIQATCAANCPCWDPVDKACNKQSCGTCGNGYKPSFKS